MRRTDGPTRGNRKPGKTRRKIIIAERKKWRSRVAPTAKTVVNAARIYEPSFVIATFEITPNDTPD